MSRLSASWACCSVSRSAISRRSWSIGRSAARPSARQLTVVLGSAAILLFGYWVLLTRRPGARRTSRRSLAVGQPRRVDRSHRHRRSASLAPVEDVGSGRTAQHAAGDRHRAHRHRRRLDAGVVAARHGQAADPGRRPAWCARSPGDSGASSFPINKNLWTSSYVLFTSGLAAMILALCYLVVDLRRQQRLARPLDRARRERARAVRRLGLAREDAAADTVLGRSVTLYRWIYTTLFQPLAPPKIASLLFACAALLVLYGLLEIMYRRRWFVRA